MTSLRVNIPNREYDILIGGGLLSNAGELIPNFSEKIIIITDSNVAPLYADKLAASLRARVITVPPGEESKSISTLQTVYCQLLDYNITRSGLIIALGGGVVGDLAGYAASTLLRGIPYVQIPTTLLAQVDSSVGGKVAVNLPQGKNLVGTFYQPKLVIIDTDCLRTLPAREFACGMAEVIKYGAIADRNLFDLLLTNDIVGRGAPAAPLPHVIRTCCGIKRAIVEEDEFDTGRRMLLNFGHTFGHAIEKHYFKKSLQSGQSPADAVRHGEAVAIGMVMACEFGERTGVTPAGTADVMREILQKYNLPVQADVAEEELYTAMKFDKKMDGDTLNLILLESIGTAVIKKVKL